MLTTRRECVEIRYERDGVGAHRPLHRDDACECICHDEQEQEDECACDETPSGVAWIDGFPKEVR